MILFLKAHVVGYTRVDGTTVKPHEARRAHAAPKPTYVSRKLVNAEALRTWAAAAGFKDITPADKMHCTVAYSKKPMHQGAIGPHGDNVSIPGGERSVAQIGSDGAVVLRFDSDKLQDRWHHMLQVGASWDFGHTAGDYLPHVTISYSAQDFDVTKVKPFDGLLVLGPEHVEDLKTGWSETLKKAGAPVRKKFPIVKSTPWRGLFLDIENPAGSVRSGKKPDGSSWNTMMAHDYGEIRGTEGMDGDAVDVFVGPEPDAPMVYVVHQNTVDQWDKYDEDKCMVGFASEAAAEAAFLANYDDPRFLGPITAMTAGDFINKVRATSDKPAMIKAVVFMRNIPSLS